MLYKKPKNLKYTDMAIYIDKVAYKEDITPDEDSLIFEYLYHISSMLAYKARLFSDSKTYDDFSVFMATRIFMRLKNPKQYIIKDDGEPKLEKIRSVLNHAKAILPWVKIDFEQEYYSQCLSYSKDESVSYSSEYNFNTLLSDSVDKLQLIDFNLCLGDIIKTTKNFIAKIPHSSSEELTNIYLSCLLTFLNSITFTDSVNSKFLNTVNKTTTNVNNIINMFNSECDVVLYHLSDDNKNYIKVLTEEIKHIIAKDLSLSLHTYIPTNNTAYLLSEINGNEYRFEE